MIQFSFRYALAAALCATLAIVGCREKPPGAAPTNAAASNQPTPEESFAQIVETFRRGIEEVPIGFVIQDSSGRQSIMTGKNVVAHKLLPPEKEGDPLKAQITVTSDTQYSLQRSAEKPESTGADQSQKSAADGSSSNGAGVQILDDVASVPGGAERPALPGSADPSASQVVGSEVYKHERAYELVHESGRWKLLTELDPKTEESIKLAFDHALSSQL